MSKKRYFSMRIVTLLLVIGIVLLANISILFFYVLGVLKDSLWAVWLLGADMLCLATCCYYFINRLWKPYQNLQLLYQGFLKEQIYEELFQENVSFAPILDKVMKHFYELLNKQEATKISMKHAEYLALQNQINPHFLYNTLDAIRGDALEASMYTIAETMEALSIFFRYMVTGVEHLVTFEEEIDNIENYFKIQQYRFGEKLKLSIHYPQEEEILQLKLPKLTLQPFVENAIFHGLESKAEGGSVEIKIETTKKKLLVIISDNGIGMEEKLVDEINGYLEKVAVSYDAEDKKKRGKIAMKNVNSRIKLLFSEEYGVHLYSTKYIGTDVNIILPRV